MLRIRLVKQRGRRTTALPARFWLLREYRRELAALDVTPAQACALLYIDRNPGTFIRRCAGALGVTAPAMGSIVKHMGQKGLVRKQRAFQDDRYVLVTATRKGTGLARKIMHLLTLARAITTRHAI